MKLIIKSIIFLILCILAVFIGMTLKEMENRDLTIKDLNKETLKEITKETVDAAKDKVLEATDKIEESVEDIADDVKKKIK